METDGNQLDSVDLVCNPINTSLGRHKSHFYVELCKRQKSVNFSVLIVAIPNLDIKVWTRKNEFTVVMPSPACPNLHNSGQNFCF